jgi:hypothetical protein
MIKQWSNRQHCKRASLLAGLIMCSMSIGAAPGAARADVKGVVSGKTANNVEYMSGGVGIDERQQMQMKAKDYDLKLSFADRRGEFISDVKVIIDDRHGKELVNLTTAGPWLFVELPTGNYELKATFAHHTEEIKDIHVSQGHLAARLLHWDLSHNLMARSSSGD